MSSSVRGSSYLLKCLPEKSVDMKKLSFTVMVTGLLLAACGSGGRQSSGEWQELESFHELMAAAWHPVADSGNFEPARSGAAAMELEARHWSEAAIPDGLDQEVVAGQIKVLLDSCSAFKRAVEAGRPDSLLRPSLAEMHHIFHRLQESWHHSGKEEKADH